MLIIKHYWEGKNKILVLEMIFEFINWSSNWVGPEMGIRPMESGFGVHLHVGERKKHWQTNGLSVSVWSQEQLCKHSGVSPLCPVRWIQCGGGEKQKTAAEVSFRNLLPGWLAEAVAEEQWSQNMGYDGLKGEDHQLKMLNWKLL